MAILNIQVFFFEHDLIFKFVHQECFDRVIFCCLFVTLTFFYLNFIIFFFKKNIYKEEDCGSSLGFYPKIKYASIVGLNILH